jgi:hypothetical protein
VVLTLAGNAVCTVFITGAVCTVATATGVAGAVALGLIAVDFGGVLVVMTISF